MGVIEQAAQKAEQRVAHAADNKIPYGIAAVGTLAGAYSIFRLGQTTIDWESIKWAATTGATLSLAATAGTFAREQEEKISNREKWRNIALPAVLTLAFGVTAVYGFRQDDGGNSAQAAGSFILPGEDTPTQSSLVAGDAFVLTPLEGNDGPCELMFPLALDDLAGIKKFQASINMTAFGPVAVDGGWGPQTESAAANLKVSLGLAPDENITNEACQAGLPQLADKNLESPVIPVIPVIPG